MIFQNVALFPNMTNYENIGYGLKVRGEMENADEKIRETAEMLQISEHLDKSPSQLSGGQQQRVALGRAIIRDPNVILMDEPLSDLDAKLKSELRVEIQRVQDELDTTIVYVTHDQEEASTMSDRIALMNHGRIEQVAPPTEIYDRPANDFVAKFIGQPSMNLVEARLDSNAIRYGSSVLLNGNDVDFPTNSEQEKEIKLGFRPRHATLTENLDESEITATINLWEPIGGE
jgi:multiple sugar transport system ATP-binding protein